MKRDFKKGAENLERYTFANRKGIPFIIQVYWKILILQGENVRLNVEKERFELYTFQFC